MTEKKGWGCIVFRNVLTVIHASLPNSVTETAELLGFFTNAPGSGAANFDDVNRRLVRGCRRRGDAVKTRKGTNASEEVVNATRVGNMPEMLAVLGLNQGIPRSWLSCDVVPRADCRAMW